MNEWPSEDDMPYPPNHPKGQHAQRESMPWDDPDHDVMADFREYLRPAGPSSISMGGVDLAPYLSQYGFGFSHPRQWRAALLRPATPLEIYLERSRERVRQQLGNVTHSWRDR